MKIFKGNESDYQSLDLDNIDGDYEDIDPEGDKLERDFLEDNKRIVKQVKEKPIRNKKVNDREQSLP